MMLGTAGAGLIGAHAQCSVGQPTKPRTLCRVPCQNRLRCSCNLAAAAGCCCRAARQELQRLESAVGRSERMAGAVLSDLRAMRQNPRATELRSEAALKLSLLRQQRSALQKEIKWIATKDV
ncbi:hypothetical protein COO60DRAFT_1058078 [Scenedesmus sp. NREL 46B-D3]|nr:hypothetical protein COO60DRAFT_1058078 [Scenedesmus sp. NREL 46B-D3]